MNDDFDINEIDQLLKELFPICRSITGNGVRKTLSILNKITKFDVKEIPSGTICYDWEIPNEWNITNAFIEDSKGNKILDFNQNNLHIVSYSIPIDLDLSFNELLPHLHTLPNVPDAIPYRTTYYNENWGFCLSFEQLQKMDRNERYHVKIESTLRPGSLTYGEYHIGGSSGLEFLISTYCCHPSLGNDNLSGLVLWTYLLRILKQKKLRHSYRFIVVPETIGAIAYLSKNEKRMKEITGGFVITSVAGPGKFGYKNTYSGNHKLDNIVKSTFFQLGLDFISYQFDINGSDETHFSSPFFRIPVGTISKDKYYEYDFYHTSKDNIDFIKSEYLAQTLQIYLEVINRLEMEWDEAKNKNGSYEKLDNKEKFMDEPTYRSLNPYCAPMLSKRGIYPTIGGMIKQKAENPNEHHINRNYRLSNKSEIRGNKIDCILWLMFYCDGITSILDISKKTGFSQNLLYKTAEELCKHRLLERI